MVADTTDGWGPARNKYAIEPEMTIYSGVDPGCEHQENRIMARYWLSDQHGTDGLTALVETDGRMQVVSVARFGPGITELDDQQEIWDKVIGKVAPTLRPFVDASGVDEPGVEPHSDLRTGQFGAASTGNRVGRGDAGGRGPGRGSGGPSRKGSRGDR